MPFHNSTPQRVLDAPTSVPIQLWPPPRKKPTLSLFASTAVPTYHSDKVRKVRRGRKARFNR